MIMRPTGRTQCCEFANWLGINAGTLGDEALNASTTLERLGSQIRSNTGAMLLGAWVSNRHLGGFGRFALRSKV